MGKILLALLVGAIIELYVVILVAGWIGFWSMLGLLVLVSIVGFTVIRMAGVRTMQRYAAAASTGQGGTKQLADGAVLLGAGLLLAIPGFVSGAFGLLLLLPPVRALVRGRISRSTAQRLGDRFRARGTTIIATYERGDVRDAPGTDVRGQLREPGSDEGRSTDPDR